MSENMTFISYAREDLAAARQLYISLQQMNLNPWLDVECLRPGQQWKLEIRRAIRQCRYFVVILSSRSVSRKGFVHKELTEALELLDMYPDSQVYLIPVRLDECEPPRERLRDIQWVDLFPNWEAGLKKLRSAFVLDSPEFDLKSSSEKQHLAIVVERVLDTRVAHANDIRHPEIYFSVKNVSDISITAYDIGLENVNVKGTAEPAAHLMACRVTLTAKLANQSNKGEAIPLFSEFCSACYDYRSLERDIKSDDSNPIRNRHSDAVLFHSIIGADRVLKLTPSEAEAFTLRLISNTGCAEVKAEFRITALYHDDLGNKRAALSKERFVVKCDDRKKEVSLRL